MKNVNKQYREGRVTLSETKGLSRWAQRCFASLSMTSPVLVVDIHHHSPTIHRGHMLDTSDSYALAIASSGIYRQFANSILLRRDYHLTRP
jgi:hypothetical protein